METVEQYFKDKIDWKFYHSMEYVCQEHIDAGKKIKIEILTKFENDVEITIFDNLDGYNIETKYNDSKIEGHKYNNIIRYKIIIDFNADKANSVIIYDNIIKKLRKRYKFICNDRLPMEKDKYTTNFSENYLFGEIALL